MGTRRGFDCIVLQMGPSSPHQVQGSARICAQCIMIRAHRKGLHNNFVVSIYLSKSITIAILLLSSSVIIIIFVILSVICKALWSTLTYKKCSTNKLWLNIETVGKNELNQSRPFSPLYPTVQSYTLMIGRCFKLAQLHLHLLGMLLCVFVPISNCGVSNYCVLTWGTFSRFGFNIWTHLMEKPNAASRNGTLFQLCTTTTSSVN